MSFFVKPKKVNGRAKFTSTNNRKKRKLDKSFEHDDEISSSDDEENVHYKLSGGEHSSSEDENETAQEKKLRLAKVYLKEIEKEERRRLEDEEFNKDVISQRLKDDHLKQIGKFESKIAAQYTGVDESAIRLLKCREQKNSVTCICVSSDNKWMFSGSKDGVVVKWSLTEKRKLGIIPFVKDNSKGVKGHSSSIMSIAMSTDLKFLVVGDKSNEIQIWNPEDLTHIETLRGHRRLVNGLVFRLNSHTLYSCSADHSVRVWSLDEMAFVENLFGHQDSICAIDALYSEKPVTGGGRDGTIRLWKVAEESQLIFNAQPGSVDAIKLINDQHFITGGDDGTLNIWSALKKKPVAFVKAAHGLDPTNSLPYWITAVTSLPHTDLVASGSQNGWIKVWKLEDRCKIISSILNIPAVGFVNSLVFTNDGKYLIAGIGRDHRLGRWSTQKTTKNGILLIPLTKSES